MGNTNSRILEKVAVLLQKIKDALIYDLEEEFKSVKEAIVKIDNPDNKDSKELMKFMEARMNIVDAIFARVGYDISHYENLNDVRKFVEELIRVTEKIGNTMDSIANASADGKVSGEELTEIAKNVIPLIKDIVGLVRTIMDMEWDKVSKDIIVSGEDIGQYIQENILTRDFARKVFDHILMTLLKNAQSVFKDEIDFVKLTIESGVKDLVNNVSDLSNEIRISLEDILNDAQADIEHIEYNMKETLEDASLLYKKMKDHIGNDFVQTAQDMKDTYVKIAHALSITNSILEFLGILEEKQLTLQLPKQIKELIGKVQSSADKVSGAIGSAEDTAYELVSNATSNIVDEMSDVMKTTKEVTGIGVAAAGKLDIQLQCVEKMVNSGTAEFEKGLAQMVAGANGALKNASSYASKAQSALGDFKGELENIKNFRYTVKVNVLSWENIVDLFTRPVEHFKSIYPINSMQDAEDLMRKFMDILHNINPDIPDFGSLKNLLEDLLRKLQQHVMKYITEVKNKMKELGNEAKTRLHELINKVWDWFQPIVTTIRNIIETLKELALVVKEKMSEVIGDIKEGVNIIADHLQDEFNEIKKGFTELTNDVKEGLDKAGKSVNDIAKTMGDKINEIENGINTIATDIKNKVTDAVDQVEDGLNTGANQASNILSDIVKDFSDNFGKYKKQMPKMPEMNMPKMVKNTFVEPLTNAVNCSLKEVVELDVQCLFDFSQERNDLMKCVTSLKKDYTRLTTIIEKKPELASILNLDETLGILAFDGADVAIEMPDIAALVQQEVLPDLNVWAHGMLTTIQTLTDKKVWKQRLDIVLTQLKAEFKNDLGNITGLISKEGAMKLLRDSSAVKKDLKDNLNITDYITILETAVNDVVIPDPEYFYTSFKQTILAVISKLTARIVAEIQNIKDNIVNITSAVKKTFENIPAAAENLVQKLQDAIDKKAAQIGAAVCALIENIIGTARTIADIAKGLPDRINKVKDFFTTEVLTILKNLGSTIEDKLKDFANKFLERLEDLASEVWQRIKNEYIIPLLNYIKNQVIFFVKHVIRNTVRKIVEAITNVQENVENGVQEMLGKLPTLNSLFMAERDFIQKFRSVYNTVKDIKEVKDYIEQADLVNGISNLNQLPGLINVIDKFVKDNPAVMDKLKELTLSIEIKTDLKIEVSYEYVIWIQNILTSTLDFVQSDMGLKEVISLVQSLYKGIPESIKNDIADVMPSLPSLPKNSFTDMLNDVSCSYDLDNMMCNITLLDLKTDEKDIDGFDASLKLQLFIMVGRYTSEEFIEVEEITDDNTEDKNEDETEDSADTEEEKEDNSVPAVFFTIMLSGKVLFSKNLGENHNMEIMAEGNIGEMLKKDNAMSDTAIGFCMSKKDPEKGVTSIFHGFGSTKGLNGIFYINFKRISSEANPNPADLLSTEYLDIRIGNYPMTGYVLYNHSYPEDVQAILDEKEPVEGFSTGIMGGLEDVEFILKLRQNKFFSTLLKDDISAKFSLQLLYDYLKGFKMDGGYCFHIDIDCNNKKIGPLTLANLGIDIGCPKNDFGTLRLGTGTTFSLQMGEAVSMSFENLKLGFDINIFKKDFSLGDFDFDFNFKFPDGIGVAIDCPAVKGAAIINYNQDTGELFGALELDVIEKFGVSAMLLLDLGIVDGHFFSMMAMLSTRFSPGIPLGMGFSLTAIGGMLGLQRMLDYNAIREAVRSGTLESTFFVSDVVKHIAEMKKTAEKIFPAKEDQFFVGLLGQISFEPVVKCTAGLMLQLPDPFEIILVGILKVSIEDTDIIRINVAFSGSLDFKKGLQFDASIYDSSIVGITLEGDMAFRLFWGGDTKGFLLSVGGFHPAYKPEAGMHVSDMRRLSMKLDYDVLRVGLETYFAVTSNSFQIGARLDIKIGWDRFGIIGYAGFDALFQFDPFMFMFSIEAGMAVMVGRLKVLSIDLSLSLSGPKPWNAKGKAKFYFLFIPVKVGFDITWGDKQSELPKKQINVMGLFKEQVNNPKNWFVDESGRDWDVVTIENKVGQSEDTSEVLILAPGSILAFNQNAIPMEETMDLCNNAVPTDYKKMMIDQIVLNKNERQILNAEENRKIEENENFRLSVVGVTLDNDFAPALFKSMTNQEKLESKSYKKYASGFTLKNDGSRKVGKGKTVELGDYDYEYGEYKTHEYNQVQTESMAPLTSANNVTGKRVTYHKTDKTAINRYMKVLDSIQ